MTGGAGGRPGRWAAGFVALAVLASALHVGYYRENGREAYPLTVYPMFASHPSGFRGFYWVEAVGADGASLGVLPAEEMFDAHHRLRTDEAQNVMARLGRLAAAGCSGTLWGPCAGQGEGDGEAEPWHPPRDLAEAWARSAQHRLGLAEPPAAFTAYRVADGGAAGVGGTEPLFSFTMEAGDA